MAVNDVGTERYDTGIDGTTRARYEAIVADRWGGTQRRVGHVNQDGWFDPPMCTAFCIDMALTGVIA
jgi:hypothetical protein